LSFGSTERLAAPGIIVQNGRARSRVALRGIELDWAEIGRLSPFQRCYCTVAWEQAEILAGAPTNGRHHDGCPDQWAVHRGVELAGAAQEVARSEAAKGCLHKEVGNRFPGSVLDGRQHGSNPPGRVVVPLPQRPHPTSVV
jgi:hypothetical protein